MGVTVDSRSPVLLCTHKKASFKGLDSLEWWPQALGDVRAGNEYNDPSLKLKGKDSHMTKCQQN